MVTECVEVYLRWCMIFVKKNGKKWNEQKSWELTVCFRWIVLKVVIFDPFLVIWAKVKNFLRISHPLIAELLKEKKSHDPK